MVIQAKIQQAAQLLAGSQRLVVLTGAGVSKESGVPTFRDAMDGLWARYDPGELATAQAFQRNPKLVWDWYEYRRGLVRQAEPNPGHRALAALETLLPQVVVITQNVDDLHHRAGSTDIVALHGAIMRNKCFHDCQGAPTLVDLAAMPPEDMAAGPPVCPYCGGWVRPDVVWFGENLPPQAISRAMTLTKNADVLLVIGTSGVVQPAASLPFLAERAGAVIIEANPNRSEITHLAEIWLDAPSGQALPEVVAHVRRLKGAGDAAGA